MKRFISEKHVVKNLGKSNSNQGQLGMVSQKSDMLDMLGQAANMSIAASISAMDRGRQTVA